MARAGGWVQKRREAQGVPPTSGGAIRFTATVFKRNRDTLGIDIRLSDLTVVTVGARLIGGWNDSAPEHSVRTGDQIVQVNDAPVTDLVDFARAACGTGQLTIVFIRRGPQGEPPPTAEPPSERGNGNHPGLRERARRKNPALR